MEPVPLGKPRSRDPKDDRYLACALGAKAEALVSNDRDLLALERPCGVAILTPVESLKLVRGGLEPCAPCSLGEDDVSKGRGPRRLIWIGRAIMTNMPSQKAPRIKSARGRLLDLFTSFSLRVRGYPSG